MASKRDYRQSKVVVNILVVATVNSTNPKTSAKKAGIDAFDLLNTNLIDFPIQENSHYMTIAGSPRTHSLELYESVSTRKMSQITAVHCWMMLVTAGAPTEKWSMNEK